jgi:hypothetical protein
VAFEAEINLKQALASEIEHQATSLLSFPRRESPRKGRVLFRERGWNDVGRSSGLASLHGLQ